MFGTNFGQIFFKNHNAETYDELITTDLNPDGIFKFLKWV